MAKYSCEVKIQNTTEVCETAIIDCVSSKASDLNDEMIPMFDDALPLEFCPFLKLIEVLNGATAI
jgi:hypothetical protein